MRLICKDEIHLQGEMLFVCFFTSLSKNIEKQPAIAEAKEHKRKITTHCVSKCIWKKNIFGSRRFT